MSDELLHYGTPRHSGRYPWGSGKNPQRNKNFYQRAWDLKKQGLSDTEVARAFNMSTTQYRALYKIAREEREKEDISKVIKLKEKGWSNTAIAKEMGRNESVIRSWLKEERVGNVDKTRILAEGLKEVAEGKPYLDVGKGVEYQLGVSQTQLKTAVEMLKNEGYHVEKIFVPQATNPSQYTTVDVLVKDGVTKQEVYDNMDKVTSPTGIYFTELGSVKNDVKPPVNVDSSRIAIRYAEDGGTNKDGVIEIRPGVADLSLGENRYCQVRIAVDGTHYLKGMAMYGQDLPEGCDILFNTNKTSDVPKMDVLKPLKKDKETGEVDDLNPFGAVTRQWNYRDANGEEHQSAINIVNDDTDWDKWSKNLASQMLSKQSPTLAKQQLDKDYDMRAQEFKEICELTNPTVKRKLLEDFSDECDSAAVHLKAAAFPRQATHVILPIESLKDNECYAPNYQNGEEVVLIRYPHQGVFEIPRLKVNNKNPEAIANLGNAEHAIGINHKVANQLSGADFDGDTVVVIPTKGLPAIKAGDSVPASSPVYKLRDFDPKTAYKKTPDMPKTAVDDHFHKGLEMGKVTNLITDMTIQGAPMDEIARAVKHSLVVIDAEKHNLDWKKSYNDNGIKELVKKYQQKDDGESGGVATIISRAKSPVHPNERKELKVVSKMTPEERAAYERGEKVYRYTNETYEVQKVNKRTGEITTETRYVKGQTSTRMAEAKDARELVSKNGGTRIENVYADYANKCKALGNAARKELISTPRLQQSKSAKETYSEERKSLISKLNIALKNAPLERQAQLIANSIFRTKLEGNPDMDKDDQKKQRQLAISVARARVESQSRKKLSISVSPREWQAIQAGAISDNQLTQILKYTKMDDIRKLATPRAHRGLSSTQRSRARTLLRSGHTQAEVASDLGISVSTLMSELNGSAA